MFKDITHLHTENYTKTHPVASSAVTMICALPQTHPTEISYVTPGQKVFLPEVTFSTG